MQPGIDKIKPLALGGQDCVRPRQTGTAQTVAALFRAGEQGAFEPFPMFIDGESEVSADGHGDFRCSGWRWCARIGDVINECGVGLVANGRDQRNLALEGCTDNSLFIERPEVFDRPAAAPDDQHVRPVFTCHGIETANTGFDLCGRKIALNQSWPQDDAGGKAVGDAVENIADNGTGRAGHDTNGARQKG